jgi:hypothetical protein
VTVKLVYRNSLSQSCFVVQNSDRRRNVNDEVFVISCISKIVKYISVTLVEKSRGVS